jgi:hypothetical protein
MMPLPAAAVEATLVAAHQLLNNPPPSHALLSVVEQWCHNVDQLMVATINTQPMVATTISCAVTHTGKGSCAIGGTRTIR